MGDNIALLALSLIWRALLTLDIDPIAFIEIW